MEAVQKISEESLVTCPDCANDTLKKIISAAGFRLKGGGWYETDFKSGKKKKAAGGENSSGGSASGSSGDAGS